MGKLEKAFHEDRKAMTEAARKGMLETELSDTEPEKEASSIIRRVIFYVAAGGGVQYLMRHVYRFKPGEGKAAVKLPKQYIAPTFQKLLDGGVILGYGLAEPEMHSGAG